MASLFPNNKTVGRVLRRIDFTAPHGGRRQRIRLGKVTAKEGDDFRHRLEILINDIQLQNHHTAGLTEWINGLPPKMQSRLQRAGLLKICNQQTKTLGDFLDEYRRDSSVKPSTLKVYDKVIRNLRDHYGANRLITTISPTDAEGFRPYLNSSKATERKKSLSTATVNRRVTYAKQFFSAAKGRQLITASPFESVVGGSQENEERLEFITPDHIDPIISIADLDWQIIMTFARYGGIRTPSELVKLRWKHICFAEDQVIIHSSKTEHHAGKALRVIPMFDEMRRPLLAASVKGVDPSDFVITKLHYRHPDANLRQHFLRLAKAAGVRPWGKTFQNMRASRETELIERISLKEACKIIGNSELVALRHYQML